MDTKVRDLMAQKRKFSDDTKSSLGGKDKVKMLKLMREIKKGSEKKSNSSNPDLVIAQFPNDDHLASSTAPSKPIRAVSEPVAAEVQKTTLPQGFFDDPVEDFKVRGIDVRKELVMREKEELKIVAEFLDEMKESEDLLQKEELFEEDEKDLDNEIVQMSYMARFAGLLNQVRPNSSENRISIDSDELEQAKQLVSSYVPVASEEKRSLQPVDGVATVESDILKIIHDKKRSSRKASRLEDSEYLPLDSSNWTALSI